MYHENTDSFGWFAEPAPAAPATPAFRFHCTSCPPHAAADCRAILARAVRDAIVLAENAVTRIRTRHAPSMTIFRTFFGDPNRNIAIASKSAADLVGVRYQYAINGFRRRVPHFRCSALGGCNGFIDPRQSLGATANPLPSNTIFVCPPFWGLAPHLRAGVLLHEMMHLIFHTFLIHGARLANAHCYEAFALRVAGHTVDPTDVACCASGTC